jgi:hypothetical protein
LSSVSMKLRDDAIYPHCTSLSMESKISILGHSSAQ